MKEVSSSSRTAIPRLVRILLLLSLNVQSVTSFGTQSLLPYSFSASNFIYKHASGGGNTRAHVKRNQVCMQTTNEAETKNRELVQDDSRLLGSRRLAALKEVMTKGPLHDEHNSKLLGSSRLAVAKDIVLKTPADSNRFLGSTRLRQTRQILFERAAEVRQSSSSKVLGSRRLGKAREILMMGIKEIRSMRKDKQQSMRTPQLPARQVEEATPSIEVAPVSDESIVFAGQAATEENKKDIRKIRQWISEISEKERESMSEWIFNRQDVEIFRYLLGFRSAKNAFEKMKATARWRKSESIDTILSEDFSQLFEPGKEEMLYLPPDSKGRPILLYRSALHTPGRVDPVLFCRYITQQTEKAIMQYKLGTEVESCVLVDRIGSGLKNQDPALLRELVPIILNHYPYQVGKVYIAPISPTFNVIWGILKLLLDESARKRFLLCDGDYTSTLLQDIPAELLPSTLGGELDVEDWLKNRRDLVKADVELAILEKQLDSSISKESISWANKPAKEEEIMGIAAVRVYIAELSDKEKEELGPWIAGIENNDILRFLRAHPSVDGAWAAIKRTSKWRNDEKIDSILEEDLSYVMPEGKEEFFYTGVDKAGRPILVYRAATHVPGKIDEKLYCRYVVQRVEQGRKKYGLGKNVQACVVVDRIGSGLKNQDPALLRELLPCFTTHFPGIVGNIYIAPVNNVFFFVWSLLSLLLDEDTKNSVKLLGKSEFTSELLGVMDSEVLPKNLGGECAVPSAGIF